MRGIRWLALLCMAWVCMTPARAQSQWAPTGSPGLIVGPLRHIYANPSRDTIYFAGIISMTGIQQDWQETNSILRYTTGQWDTLGVINGQVQTIVQYRDTLIAGGVVFLSCSGTPCSGAAYWDGNAWQPYGDFGSSGVRMLRVFDDELYAVGGFTEVDGQPASGVAKRMGSAWLPVGTFDLEGSILDIAKYDGKLVVIGNVDFDNGRSIAEWDGSDWHVLGPGIINLMSSAQCLAVFQDNLYVGGQIALAPPGNPGQNIMRWDGTQFHNLGQGIQWWLGDQNSVATVLEMVEHDGKLFVGGGYRAAGGIEALGLSTWDGVEWCAVPGDFRASGGIWAMDFYHDTLFVACGATLDSNTVNGTAKFIGEEYTTVCSGPVGIPQYSGRGTPKLYPNPAADHAILAIDRQEQTLYDVVDAAGSILLSGSIPPTSEVSLPLSDLAPGVYAVRLQSEVSGPANLKLIKQ